MKNIGLAGLGGVVESEKDTNFRERVIEKLSRIESETKSTTTAIERLTNRLDKIDGRVQENEKKLSRLSGIAGLVFAFFSTILGVIGWHK